MPKFKVEIEQITTRVFNIVEVQAKTSYDAGTLVLKMLESGQIEDGKQPETAIDIHTKLIAVKEATKWALTVRPKTRQAPR